MNKKAYTNSELLEWIKIFIIIIIGYIIIKALLSIDVNTEEVKCVCQNLTNIIRLN